MKKTGDGKDGRRVARVEQEIQKVIAQYLIQGFRLPIPGIVSVARVMMPGDLRTAKVYVSHLGEIKDRNHVVELLQERAFEIQEHIGHELRMRFCPRLTFFLDDTTERILEIDRILGAVSASTKERSKENATDENLVESKKSTEGSGS